MELSSAVILTLGYSGAKGPSWRVVVGGSREVVVVLDKGGGKRDIF